MKLGLIFAFVLSLAACVTPLDVVPPSVSKAPVSKEQSAFSLRSKTVALVRGTDDGPAPFCTGVWVTPSTFLTAQHCVDEDKMGGVFVYTSESDVFGKGDPHPKANIQVRLASLKKVDAIHDLALLHAPDPPEQHGIVETVASRVTAGQFVQTMGHSIGLWYSYSSGDVSAVRWIDAGDGSMMYVQTTVPTSPGNSGGGLFNENLELVGLCHGTVKHGQNISFYVHAQHIAEFLKDK